MFSKFFIHRPVFASVISIVIVLVGIIAIKALPIEQYPQLSPPRIVVSTFYSGADAQTIAKTVVAPLEDAINGVDDMIYIQSTSSSSGQMTMNIFFKSGADPQKALVNVNNRIRLAQARLPQEVQRVGLHAFEMTSNILKIVAFVDDSKSMDAIELNNFVTLNVVGELERLPGVGSVALIGGKDYSMRVWIKPDMLKFYSLTIPEVIAAIREQNAQYAVGKLGEEPLNADNPYVYSINPEGRLKTAKDFENIILRSDAKGSMIRLKDVAEISLGAEKYVFEGYLDDKPAAAMLISTQNNANALNVSALVDNKLDEISRRFPGGIRFDVPYDTTTYVKITLKEVVKTFFAALVLVIAVMYLFLGNLRATIIPLLTIPVSVIGAFAGLYAMGFSINMITLFALILGIGIVVDDAIIVIENVERNLEQHPELSVIGATEKAMGEIFSPVISIVLVLSAVFIPVGFMEGFVGVMQKQFALTLVVAVCISGLVALTLTPALCAKILTKERKAPFVFVRKFNAFFDKSTQIFSTSVAKILRHIIPASICVAVLLIGTAVLYKFVPGGLVPNEDTGNLIVINRLPSALSVNQTTKHGKSLQEVALKDENIKSTILVSGYDLLTGNLRENASVMFFQLKHWDERKSPMQSSFALSYKYNMLYSQNRTGITFVVNPPSISGLSMTGGFELFAQTLGDKSYQQISADMQRVVMEANKRPELRLVRTTLDINFPQYDMVVNKEKAKMLGISLGDVFATINSTIGTYYVNDFNLFNKTYKVNLRALGEYRDSINSFRDIFVKSRTTGDMVPLNSLITLKRSLGPDSVDRFNGFPAAKIMGEPNFGYTSGEAIKAISDVFDTLFPSQYVMGWAGSSYQEVASHGTGQTAFIFGLIFVYLVLAAQYERWIMPLAVLTAVPFSLFGALVAVFLRGLSNDIYFQIGLLVLIGLGAKNAILIVEFAMDSHLGGKNIFDASVEAAKLRFRPIVMTSLAFILGVLPLVFATGAGSASKHSLGTGVLGGMILASTIAIFFIPMFYYLLENFKEWLGKKRHKGVKNAY